MGKEMEKKEDNYNKHNELHAFLIPKVDLLEVLAEGIDAVRAYIGVEKIKENGKDKYVEKLMIVGTKLDPATGIYVDMITDGSTNEKLEATVDSIYDFTRPCPSACDPNSPLNI
ncbi:MAG: hypothetical protein HC854_17995 [Flavobacterium sp.]|nr:hypothetical protein [Flavobacterium sp.]